MDRTTETYSPDPDALQLEPANDVHRRSGFVAKLTVGGRGALLTPAALAEILKHGDAILQAERYEVAPPAAGAIGTADVATRR